MSRSLKIIVIAALWTTATLVFAAWHGAKVAAAAEIPCSGGR